MTQEPKWLQKVREAKPELDALYEMVKKDATDEFEIGRLAYTLYQKGLSWRVMANHLREREVEISHTWLHKQAVTYDWWVVKNGYAPDALARYSRNKLYYMAAHKLDDVSLLNELKDLSDSAFIAELKQRLGIEAPNSVISIPTNIRERIHDWQNRLAALANQPISFQAALEFGLEVLMQMPDNTVRLLWKAVHGEAAEEEVEELVA